MYLCILNKNTNSVSLCNAFEGKWFQSKKNGQLREPLSTDDTKSLQQQLKETWDFAIVQKLRQHFRFYKCFLSGSIVNFWCFVTRNSKVYPWFSFEHFLIFFSKVYFETLLALLRQMIVLSILQVLSILPILWSILSIQTFVDIVNFVDFNDFCLFSNFVNLCRFRQFCQFCWFHWFMSI